MSFNWRKNCEFYVVIIIFIPDRSTQSLSSDKGTDMIVEDIEGDPLTEPHPLSEPDPFEVPRDIVNRVDNVMMTLETKESSQWTEEEKVGVVKTRATGSLCNSYTIHTQ